MPSLAEHAKARKKEEEAMREARTPGAPGAALLLMTAAGRRAMLDSRMVARRDDHVGIECFGSSSTRRMQNLFG